jgi:hypothetical protein
MIVAAPQFNSPKPATIESTSTDSEAVTTAGAESGGLSARNRKAASSVRSKARIKWPEGTNTLVKPQDPQDLIRTLANFPVKSQYTPGAGTKRGGGQSFDVTSITTTVPEVGASGPHVGPASVRPRSKQTSGIVAPVAPDAPSGLGAGSVIIGAEVPLEPEKPEVVNAPVDPVGASVTSEPGAEEVPMDPEEPVVVKTPVDPVGASVTSAEPGVVEVPSGVVKAPVDPVGASVTSEPGVDPESKVMNAPVAPVGTSASRSNPFPGVGVVVQQSTQLDGSEAR